MSLRLSRTHAKTIGRGGSLEPPRPGLKTRPYRGGASRPALALSVVLAGVGTLVGGAWVTSARSQPQVVEITAERFAFTPSEVRVKAGVPVEFRLRSDDTDHGFHIVGTDTRVTIPKRTRGVTTVTFEPKAGRYTFECSEICGAGHTFMRGTIIAEE